MDRLSSQKALAGAFSYSLGHISRLLRGSRKVFLDDILKILAFIEVSPRLVVETVFEGEPVKPVQLLRAFRKGDGLSSESFLQAVAARVPYPVAAGARRKPSGPVNRQMLLGLEEDRFQEPSTVKAKLEELILAWLEPNAVAGATHSDIAMALAIWASIQRIRDHHDDASTAYTHAFAFVENTRDLFILGWLHQKVASLLMDLQRPWQGIQMLKEALILFIQADEQHFQARVFVDLGILYNSIGQYDEAIIWHDLALRHLPEDSIINRFAVHFDLAWAQFNAGETTRAQESISRARALQPENAATEISLLWLEGDIWRRLGATDQANAAYRKSRDSLVDQGRFAEAILVTLILGQALLEAGKTAPLKEVVLDLQQLIKRLRTQPPAAKVIDTLALTYFKGKFGPKLFEDAHREFGAALEPLRGRSHQT